MPLSVAVLVICPKCKTLRSFVNTSAGGTQYRCGGCEWVFTFTAVASTSVLSAAIVTPATATALTVASGGASFTNGMRLLIDTGVNAEVAQVTGAPTGTSIPVPLGSLAKPHSNGAAFGQLSIISTYAAAGQEAVPGAPGWGF